MYLSRKDIETTPRVDRLKLINAVSGIKPGNLIGTKSNDGQSNLAIFSSIVHLGSNPAMLGFIMRPTEEIRRHTYENIMENGCFTVNHVHISFIEKAHYTSGKFEKEESEFELCGLTEEYLPNFSAPFVKESSLKMGLKHIDSVPIKVNGTIMIIGTIEHLIYPDKAIDEKGHINLETIGTAGISGLNYYYELKKIGDFPYVRIGAIPDLTKK